MRRSRTRSLRRTPAPVVRRKPRQPRAIVTIDAILIAVERILDTHGPAGLTTNRVAEIAGVSIGSLYQYYPNKQALIAAVQERVLDELYESLDIVLTSSGERALAEIVELVARGMLDVYSARRSVYRWLIELRRCVSSWRPSRARRWRWMRGGRARGRSSQHEHHPRDA